MAALVFKLQTLNSKEQIFTFYDDVAFGSRMTWYCFGGDVESDTTSINTPWETERRWRRVVFSDRFL